LNIIDLAIHLAIDLHSEEASVFCPEGTLSYCALIGMPQAKRAGGCKPVESALVSKRSE